MLSSSFIHVSVNAHISRLLSAISSFRSADLLTTDQQFMVAQCSSRSVLVVFTLDVLINVMLAQFIPVPFACLHFA